MKRRQLTLILPLLLGACAAQRSSVNIASASASILNDYRKELEGFAARQNALNADNMRRLRDLHELTGEREARINERVLAIRLSGDKPALELFELLSAPSASGILSGNAVLRSLRPTEPAPKIEADGAKAQGLVKQLKALQKAQPVVARIMGLADYRNKLAETYRKSLAEAGKEAGQAAAQSNDLTMRVAEEGGQ